MLAKGRLRALTPFANVCLILPQPVIVVGEKGSGVAGSGALAPLRDVGRE